MKNPRTYHTGSGSLSQKWIMLDLQMTTKEKLPRIKRNIEIKGLKETKILHVSHWRMWHAKRQQVPVLGCDIRCGYELLSYHPQYSEWLCLVLRGSQHWRTCVPSHSIQCLRQMGPRIRVFTFLRWSDDAICAAWVPGSFRRMLCRG